MEKERQREALAREDAVAVETKCLRDELKMEQQQRNALKTSVSNLKQVCTGCFNNSCTMNLDDRIFFLKEPTTSSPLKI